MTQATVLIVPALRDHVAEHWQTLLETNLRTEGRPVACVMLAHWARRTRRQVRGALLAAPPEFDRPLARFEGVAQLARAHGGQRRCIPERRAR